MKKYVFVIFLLFLSIASYAVEKPLPTSGWIGHADGSTTISVSGQNPLVAEVNVVGSQEGYPRLALNFSGEDWRKYQKIAFDVKLESTSPCILDGGKDMVVVLIDQNYQYENTMGVEPVNQQMTVPHVDAGDSWQSVEVDMRNLSRKGVSMLLLYLYSKPFNFDHNYKVSFRNIRLIGNEDNSLFFDGTDFANQSMPVGSGSSLSSLTTNDGLKMDITSTGALSGISVDGVQVGEGVGQSSGIMLRDAKTSQPPVMPQGTLTSIINGVRQQATVSSLSLDLDASYKNLGDRISVSGKVTSTNNEDRSVTVYVALPVSDNTNWEFHKSLIHKTAPFADVASVPQLEDVCTEYAVAVLADKSNGTGLALMMDQSKPINYRLVVNPKQKLFYVAFDVALLNQNRFDGMSQKSVDFQIEIVRTDGAWGFRSGLEKLYTIHADLYEDKLGYSGGWELYTRGQFNYTNEQNIAGGYRFDWSAADNDRTLWEQNVSNNFLNLLYTEPEYMQFSMGDNTAPTISQTAERFNKLMAGDATEWETFMKLGYSQWYCGTIHAKSTALRPFTDNILASAEASVVHDRDGNPVWNLGNRDWIQDLKHGAMMPCNISPNIPGGRGTVMREIGMDPLYEEYLSNGWTAPSGFALDEFMMSPDDYRRENFKYMEIPVSFDPVTKQPMVVRGFSSVEWIKKLWSDYTAKSRNLYLLANCKGSMTFVAPYLDIFGIENTYPLDPNYYRVLAGKKRAVTNVSYTPPPKANLEYNLLWCIYTGRNATYDVLTPIVKMGDKLYDAGWEPVTGAEVSPSSVRIERYGSMSSDTVYLVIHNMATTSQNVKVTYDTDIIGKRTKAQLVYNGTDALNIVSDSEVSTQLAGRETKVIMLTKDKYLILWDQAFDITYGSPDIALTAKSENPDLSVYYTSDKPEIAEIDGSKLKVKHAGIVNITAIQEGTETIGETKMTKNIAIKKKGIAVTPTSNSKLVGEADPELKFTYTENALVSGDSFSGNMIRQTGESAGRYAINQGTLALSSDYLMNFTSGYFFIVDNAGALTVTDIILNNGINPVVKSTVRLDNVVTGGTPAQAIVSENAQFSQSQWQAYKTSLDFSLSAAKGFKTIYFKVKDSAGAESNTVEKTLYYLPENYLNEYKSGLIVYPNPVNTQAMIKIEGLEKKNSGRNSVKVMTVNGILLDRFEMEGTEISHDFSSYRSGMLMIVVENQQDKFVQRILKK